MPFIIVRLIEFDFHFFAISHTNGDGIFNSAFRRIIDLIAYQSKSIVFAT